VGGSGEYKFKNRGSARDRKVKRAKDMEIIYDVYDI
jgi:hypothetical protein